MGMKLLIKLGFLCVILFLGCTPPQVTHHLVIQKEGEGRVDPKEGTYYYEKNALIPLEAYPHEDWAFKEWVGEVVDQKNPKTYVLMDKDKTVKSIFMEKGKQEKYQVSFFVEDEDGKNIPDAVITFEHISYDPGDYLIEGVTAGTYWYLVEKVNYRSVEGHLDVHKDMEVIITLIQEVHTYSLTISIEGEGLVEKEPSLDLYEDGTEVTLRAIPFTYWLFSHWTGDLEGVENPVLLTMDQSREITAVFREEITATVTVKIFSIGPSTIYRVWVFETNQPKGVGFKILDLEQETTLLGEEMSRNTLEPFMPLFLVDDKGEPLAMTPLSNDKEEEVIILNPYE